MSSNAAAGVTESAPTAASILKSTMMKERTESLTSEDRTSVPSSMDPTAATFVDYRHPPSAKVLPPAKYKLWMIVFVLVYFAIWCAELAGLVTFLRFRGWLSPEAAQFLAFALIVFVMVYAALDFVVLAMTFSWGGNKYGLGPWLQAGRVEWIHHNRFSDSFPVECIKFAIHILEDGFGMFNKMSLPGNTPPAPASHPKPHPASTGGIPKTPAGLSPQKGKDLEDDNGKVGNDVHPHQTHHRDANDDDHDSTHGDVYCTCTSDNCPIILKIEHHLNPDRMQDYMRWKKRVNRAVRLFPGFLDVKSMDIVEEELIFDDGEPLEGDEETGAGVAKTTRSSQPRRTLSRTATDSMNVTTHSVKSNLHTIYVTFDNVDSLNDWMLSHRRKALMKQLEPMLAVPSHALIQAERDAFSALVTQQGSAMPTLPPKKWKVWWLTTLALNISFRWAGNFLPYYMEFWGLDEKSRRLQTLVSAFILTFLNSYICTPFLLFLFAPWLVRKKHDVDERLVWKLLDDGIKSPWLKLLVTAVFYGGCVLTWAVKK